ncbi:MAG TPA: tRNA (adenosine(37)-N6)-threonylcarbamoyltransferase complex dimerization subunit type 1 TsaB [Gammaproteobacteria bacterium]|nr:tRNA (adenosine(37)-N6)-threonylcarbamoyltransferase complex dimerization subunit type 1 TsaB [Gammaproteobacteria bacterium]
MAKNINILSLETSTEACSVALYADGKITAKYEIAPQKHAVLLLPYCDELLSAANITPADLSAIAFGRGPGSFTGVRIAAAATQGIAIAHDIPIIPVSTLQILAQAAYIKTAEEKILAGIDARMGEIYFGQYELNKANNCMELIGEEVVSKLENLNLESIDKNNKIFRAGSAFQTKDIVYPSAEALLAIALNYYHANKTSSAEVAIPVYLRDNVV